MASTPFKVSVRDQIVPVPAGGSLFDSLRSLGTDSFEALVDVNEFLPYVRVADDTAFSVYDGASIRQLKRRLDTEGVRASALLVSTDFSGNDAERHVRWASRVVRAARELGSPVVRIDPWTAKRSLLTGTIRDNFVRHVQRVLDQTADTGVDLGMENHAHLFNDPQLLDEVFAAVPDPRLGMTLDTGNFYWWGHPLSEVYRLIEKYAPRTHHTHIKNINYPPELAEQRREIGYEYKKYCCPLYEGTLDLRRVVDILRRGGYSRDLCVEDESLFKFPEDQRLHVLRRDVEALRNAI